MKIVFLNKYQKKVFRGSETFVYELSKRLAKNNEVDVIDKINYIELLKKDYDVIIPTNGRLQVVMVRIISWIKGAKMVVSGQSGIGWDEKINLLSFPDAFVALTEKSRNWAKKFNPFVRVEKGPNGVDLQRFVSKGTSIKTNLKKPIVLSVGAFTEQKRLNLVIRAVAKLKNASLLIVGGGGDLKDNLEAQGRNLLNDKFQIMSVPFEKMPEVYRVADVFTLPSASSESFGNVLVEAMASGLPVVATDDPIRKEIIGNAGILVDPTDIDNYALALKKALSTNWGNNPREQSEKFSWDKIAEQYEELFKTLINKK